MAENPYVNKVVFGNNTVLDLTEDSVTENTLLEGETAHRATGEPITGTAKQGHIIWNAIKTALSPQRLKLWFADAKVTDDSTEQATKVEVVQLIDDESELTNAPDGVYQGDYDDAPEDVLDASMVAYKNGSVEDALDGFIEEDVEVTWNAKLVGNANLRSAKRIGNLVFVTCQSNVSAQIDTSEVIVSGLPNGAAVIVNFISASADSFPSGLNMFYLMNGNIYSRQNVSYLYLNLIYVVNE